MLENTTGNNQFPTPGTGKIMTLGPDKKLYVSVWGFGAALGSGQILQIDLKD